LIEMLVVLAVLAMLAALAWPALRGLSAQTRLKDAAGQLRVALARTRLHAIESGMPWRFRFQPGTGRFETAAGMSADDDQPWSTTPTAESDTELDTELGNPTEDEADEQTLPHGVTFCDPEQLDAPPLAPEEASRSQRLPWSAPIVFYPNGRTSNARIWLADRGDLHVDVVLRGLTATATIGRPKRIERPEDRIERQGPGEQP
jgi:type II secretory pathway pseudopilin PulG